MNLYNIVAMRLQLDNIIEKREVILMGYQLTAHEFLKLICMIYR